MKSKKDKPYRSGYVAVMGKPNVGKSTLINAILGQKINAVSPRAQTTRKMQLGILTNDKAQVVFVDTPGLHNPRHKLGNFMNLNAVEALDDADIILFVVDGSEATPDEEDRILTEHLNELKTLPKVILAINKIDRLGSHEYETRKETFLELYPAAQLILISATRRDGLDELTHSIISNLPEGEAFYPNDQITDLYEKEISADLIRASALIHLRDEVPHSIAVRIDEYTERGDKGAYIAATLFVERDSQKGIVIGDSGKMLKLIGTTSRKEIEAMSGRKVFLELRVKVRKNWRNDEAELRRFGF